MPSRPMWPSPIFAWRSMREPSGAFESLAWMTWTFEMPEHLLDARGRWSAARGGRDIEAGGEQVAGVEAVADREIGQVARQIADGLQFFEAAAEVASRADRVLDQHGEMRRVNAVRGVAQAEHERGDPFFDGVAAIAAGMQHQVLRADRRGALQFAAKALDRLAADRRDRATPG